MACGREFVPQTRGFGERFSTSGREVTSKRGSWHSEGKDDEWYVDWHCDDQRIWWRCFKSSYQNDDDGDCWGSWHQDASENSPNYMDHATGANDDDQDLIERISEAEALAAEAQRALAGVRKAVSDARENKKAFVQGGKE